MEILSGTHIDFMGRGKYAIIVSLLLMIGTVFIWFEQGKAKFGTDFIGGYEFIIKIDKNTEANSGQIRSALESEGLGGAVVQSFEEGSNEFAIRLAGEGDEHAGAQTATINRVHQALEKVFPQKFEDVSNSYVGPTIGKELQRKGLIALALGIIGILAYITYRFEFAFALGAVAAVFHDVIVSVGVYLFFGYTLNMTTLAAALTILGYSVNDTIVVFDRMREEIFKRKEYELIPLMNDAINATLSRTIITNGLTLVAALALLIFGGGAIKDLSMFMVVGVIVGSYSTIFIASPIALAWENFRNPQKAAEA